MQTDMQTVQEAIERRWVGRIVQARSARAESRKAAHLGNMAASAELEDLARDLGMEIDTSDNGALMERVIQIESESEQAAEALGEEV